MSNTEQEQRLLEHIARRPAINQRELAESVSLSLGTTNALLKKLSQYGHLKVQTVNSRRHYVLTRKGEAERLKSRCLKAARSYSDFKRISSIVRANVAEQYALGLRSFVISVPPELEDMLRDIADSVKLPDAVFSFEPDLERALVLGDAVFSAYSQRASAKKRVVPIFELPGAYTAEETSLN